ncbi:esterase [Pseudescherichia vulneris]|nr:esterase [Pseudescherichia vulneris]
MTQANLSETLFKPRFKHPETSDAGAPFSAGVTLLLWPPHWTGPTFRTGIG